MNKLLVLVATSLLVLCTSCSEQTSQSPTANAQTVIQDAGKDSQEIISSPMKSEISSAPVLRFCVPPWQKDKTQKESQLLYKPMLDWIGKKVNRRFTVITANTYEEAVELLASGTVDIANLSPVPYVLSKDINPDIKLIATCLQWSKDGKKKIDSYGGFILTLKTNTEINSIEDMKGKSFGFVKKQSSSGFKYPNALLLEKGIHFRKYFSTAHFLGSHPRVTDAIAQGSIEAGATWDHNWEQAIQKHGDIFKVIEKTPRIPNLCVAAHPNLPDELVLQIQAALLEIDESVLEGLSMCGFIIKDDSFYDVVRSVTKSSK